MPGIHDAIKIDDVRGHIVGDFLTQCRLHYEGRAQGQVFYVRDGASAADAGNERIAKKRDELGVSFAEIYPKDAWEVRIY